jgi:hypothetical protein
MRAPPTLRATTVLREPTAAAGTWYVIPKTVTYASCITGSRDSRVNSGMLIKLPTSTAKSNSVIACAEKPIRPKAAPISPRKMKIKSTISVNMTNAVMASENGRTFDDLLKIVSNQRPVFRAARAREQI